MFHLPDLPIVGYATERQKRGTDAIMVFLREIERERLRLLTIVCEGLDRWRVVARSAFGRSMNVDDEAICAMFRYLELLACRPAYQRRLLDTKHPDEWRAVMRQAMPDIEKQRESVKLIWRQ
jgi:hypothetical protein